MNDAIDLKTPDMTEDKLCPGRIVKLDGQPGDRQQNDADGQHQVLKTDVQAKSHEVLLLLFLSFRATLLRPKFCFQLRSNQLFDALKFGVIERAVQLSFKLALQLVHESLFVGRISHEPPFAHVASARRDRARYRR
jgi:hypothetical protein